MEALYRPPGHTTQQICARKSRVC